MQELGLWVGFTLTIFVYSYILGDNLLYRLAVYIFVGLAAGFIAIVTIESVLLPWLRLTVLSGELAQIGPGMIPFLLGALLLVKTSSRLGRLGNLAIAFVIGVGAAVALVGALSGTLLPLANSAATGVRDGLLEGIIVFIGVASSLVYFQYMARRNPDGTVVRGRVSFLVGTVGQGFIVVTLGALYAAAIITSLTIFSERVAFMVALIGGG